MYDYVYITLDEELDEGQVLHMRYADGGTVSPADATGTQLTVDTDIERYTVGGHITEGGISWVPIYSFPYNSEALSNMPSLTNVNGTKPEAAAAYAVLDGVVSSITRDGYVEATFRVFSSEQELLTEGRTSVFAQGSEQTVFYDNDPVFSSGPVSQGYSSYTTGGYVTFVIQSSSLDISAIPLQLFSGETKLELIDLRNRLEGLELSNGALTPTFDAEERTYQATVGYTVSSLTVTPTAADAGSTVTVQVNDAPAVAVASGASSNALTLKEGANTVLVVVTAEDKMTTRTYTLTVTREARPLSAIADLSGLSLSQGTLSPDFDAELDRYQATVGYTVNSLSVTPTTADAGSTVTVQVNDGPAVAVASGVSSSALALKEGANTVLIVVTAEDKVTTRTYTLTVTRSSQPSPPGNIYVPPVVQGPVTSTTGKLTLPASTAGELSLQDNRVRLAIPAGASPRAVELSITEVMNTEGLLQAGEQLASPVFELLKSYTDNFSQPVTLSFAFDPAKVQKDQTVAVFFYDEADKAWVLAGESKVEGNRVSVQVDHFTKFAVFAVNEMEETPETESPSTEPELPSTEPEVTVNLSDIVGHWAELGIRQAVRSGFVTGYPDGTFKPGHTVTRAEFTVMLVSALHLEGEGSPLTFSDRENIGAWAQTSIALAVEAGIIQGYEDGSFRPGAAVTRAEMAVMLAHALNLSEAQASAAFTDERTIPAWARSAVATLARNGIVQGNAAGNFQPGAMTTRAEAVTALLRALESME
ncbi:S-layer homology domain-containing protein [Paenibacillus sp. 1P07SE]|uniref:S-layer homology domain-containing protein n=1 Tax=Paenibacillus sp. 1P07SE TaxID=3132209 RepID=UPI0039A4CDBA